MRDTMVSFQGIEPQIQYLLEKNIAGQRRCTVSLSNGREVCWRAVRDGMCCKWDRGIQSGGRTA